MKVKIEYTSSADDEKSRAETVNTLEDLVSLMKQEKHPLILTQHGLDDEYEGCELRIEVYDRYRE